MISDNGRADLPPLRPRTRPAPSELLASRVTCQEGLPSGCSSARLCHSVGALRRSAPLPALRKQSDKSFCKGAARQAERQRSAAAAFAIGAPSEKGQWRTICAIAFALGVFSMMAQRALRHWCAIENGSMAQLMTAFLRGRGGGLFWSCDRPGPCSLRCRARGS